MWNRNTHTDNQITSKHLQLGQTNGTDHIHVDLKTQLTYVHSCI